jgi:hypothetical protein
MTAYLLTDRALGTGGSHIVSIYTCLRILGSSDDFMMALLPANNIEFPKAVLCLASCPTLPPNVPSETRVRGLRTAVALPRPTLSLPRFRELMNLMSATERFLKLLLPPHFSQVNANAV